MKCQKSGSGRGSLLLIIGIAMFPLCINAATRTSSNYTITSESLAPGGSSSSVNYSISPASMNPIAGATSSSNYTVYHGFVQAPSDTGGNTPGTAEPLPSGDSITQGVLSPTGDRDWYRIDIPNGGAAVHLTTNGDTDTYGRLYAADGTTLIAEDDNSGSNGLDFRIVENLAPGTYYIEVGGAGDAATGAYELWSAITAHTFRSDSLTGLRRSRLKGNNRYNGSGAGQIVRVRPRSSGAGKYFISGQNDGNFTDSLKFRITKGSRRSVDTTILRLTGGRKNVTGRMERGGYVHPNVSPGGRVDFQVRTRGTRSRTFKVRTYSIGNGSLDATKATVLKPR